MGEVLSNDASHKEVGNGSGLCRDDRFRGTGECAFDLHRPSRELEESRDREDFRDKKHEDFTI